MSFEIYNPKNKELNELPFIYGFNNGGSEGFMYAQLLTEDGVGAGSHLCSNESYMPYDLGCIEGSRPDRHEGFRKIYPDGYQMEFISSEIIDEHEGFKLALSKAKEHQKDSDEAKNASISVEYSE